MAIGAPARLVAVSPGHKPSPPALSTISARTMQYMFVRFGLFNSARPFNFNRSEQTKKEAGQKRHHSIGSAQVIANLKHRLDTKAPSQRKL